MSHSLDHLMEISRMHQHFENWNDMKHEAKKFWSAQTISLKILQNYSHTLLAQ